VKKDFLMKIDDQQSKSKGGSSASGMDDMPLIPKEFVTQYLEINDN